MPMCGLTRASRSSSVHRTFILARNVHTLTLVFTNTHDPRYTREGLFIQTQFNNWVPVAPPESDFKIPPLCA
jgi:hypothetical protein